MRVTVKNYHAVAQWQWDLGAGDRTEEEEDVCGICRVSYEGCCPACKVPGDDCPLSAYSASVVCRSSTLIGDSLGRMLPCLSYALSLEMDIDCAVAAAVSYGSSPLGYVLSHRCPFHLIQPPRRFAHNTHTLSSHRRTKDCCT